VDEGLAAADKAESATSTVVRFLSKRHVKNKKDRTVKRRLVKISKQLNQYTTVIRWTLPRLQSEFEFDASRIRHQLAHDRGAVCEP
jgi:hypothetical protein